jgi:hypothetical protein
VTLAYATCRRHALIGRALYLPERCAAHEEHRELADCRSTAAGHPGRSRCSVSMELRNESAVGFYAVDSLFGSHSISRTSEHLTARLCFPLLSGCS